MTGESPDGLAGTLIVLVEHMHRIPEPRGLCRDRHDLRAKGEQRTADRSQKGTPYCEALLLLQRVPTINGMGERAVDDSHGQSVPQRSPVLSSVSGKATVRPEARHVLDLQRQAGNRAFSGLLRDAPQIVQRAPPATVIPDVMATFIEKGDWHGAAWALAQKPPAERTTLLASMTPERRQRLSEGALHGDISWSTALIGIIFGLSPRDAVIGAFRFGMWAHLYDMAATNLNGLNPGDITSQLAVRSAEELRYLDDAGQRLPSEGVYIRPFIAARLKALGATDTTAKAGREFGEMTISVGTIVQGDKAAGKRYDYPITITFKPDAAAVKADKIAFIQRVRLVDTATGDDRDWDTTNKKRQTPRHSSVDRVPGKTQGWYGMNDDGTNGGNLHAWLKAAPATPATMSDTPGARLANTTWEFETGAVCVTGPDAGKVYATITWGFTVDKDWQITALANKTFNKPTTEFSGAVAGWNAQAAGPAADRNAPGQLAFPALK